MPVFDFDQPVDRTQSSATKYKKFGPDVLPMWIADMDFATPPSVMQALKERLEHPILGYTDRPDSLMQAFQAWLRHCFDWEVPADWVVWLPGVVPGLNLAAQTLPRGASLLVPTPVYYPFLDVAANAGLKEVLVELKPNLEDGLWGFDWAAMEAAKQTHKPAMVSFCNPQNPTGRCYSVAELTHLGDFAADLDMVVVSDEIHANIVLDESCQHHPFGKVCPQLRSISLFAATKTYNIPGLSCAAAVIPDAELRAQFLAVRRGLIPGIGPLGFAASEAAFAESSGWLEQLLDYLRKNLTLVQQSLGARVTPLQGTYLAWIDVRDVAQSVGGDQVEAHFAAHGLGLSGGHQFGDSNYARLNFACPTAQLEEALRRLHSAL